MKSSKILFLLGFLMLGVLVVPSAYAQADQMAGANKAYVKCLVNAFNQQAGKSRVTKKTLSSACTVQEKAYFDAVYNQNPSLQSNFKNNNARAAIRRIKAKVFKTFGV